MGRHANMHVHMQSRGAKCTRASPPPRGQREGGHNRGRASRQGTDATDEHCQVEHDPNYREVLTKAGGPASGLWVVDPDMNDPPPTNYQPPHWFPLKLCFPRHQPG